jgi:hypothetical protein
VSDTASTAKRVSDVAAPEAYREVGSAGNPAFLRDAATSAASRRPPPSFKDRQGIVHLKGAVTCPGTSQTAFQLPPGYRRMSGSSWNFGGDPRGLTVRR